MASHLAQRSEAPRRVDSHGTIDNGKEVIVNPWKQPASDNEPDFSLDTYKDNWDKGRGSSSGCPRAGAVILQTGSGAIRQVTTNCNTWSCVSCRDRNLKRFKAVVASGCLMLGRCSFITITYKAGSERLGDAGCVQKDWQALMRRLKQQSPWIQKLAYLRVTEVTKKGTPHIHAIFGTIPQRKRINCWGSEFRIGNYKDRMASCDCFSHEVGRSWSAVNGGESYICFGIAVTSARGAGAYLGKYMSKNMFVGHGRRFNKSRDWPSEKRRRLLAGPEGFVRALWTPGAAPGDLELKWDDIPRSGTDAQRRATHKQAAERLLRIGAKVVDIT